MFNKIISHFSLVFHPILINAFVYYKQDKVVQHNWGDDINYFFLKEISKRPVEIFSQLSLAFRLNLKNYLVIGSTIDMLCRKNTEVWGAGIIDGTKKLKVKPKKVYAVRGPLTRKVLLEQGVECPKIYGDPALLIAKFYQPNVEKKFKYGFISHVSNLKEIEKISIGDIPVLKRKDVLLIDLSKYNNWKDIPDMICSCENILSSSLHGLIVSEAYGIPNAWLEFGKPLIGGHFKFHDFFMSIGKDRKGPNRIVDNVINEDFILDELNKWKPGKIDLDLLIKVCPFGLKI